MARQMVEGNRIPPHAIKLLSKQALEELHITTSYLGSLFI